MTRLAWTRSHLDGDYEEWTATDARGTTYMVCPSPASSGWNRRGWRLFRRGAGCANFTSPDRLYPSRQDAIDAAEGAS